MWLQTQAGELAMTEDHGLTTLFDEAIDAIQSTVPKEDQRTLRQHEEIASLIEDLRLICASHSNQNEHQRLLTCSRKMSLFARTFAPFFDTVNMFGLVRSEWIGWFWGVIGLVFKVGSNHVLFLEKTTDVFEAVAYALPQYQRFNESMRRRSKGTQHRQLTSLMSYVYSDLIQFCLDLYCMFSRQSQGARLRHRVDFLSAGLCWRPLDSRFARLLHRLALHGTWLAVEEKEFCNPHLLTRNRLAYFELLHLDTRAEENGEVEAARMSRRLRRAVKVQKWLSNCCAYRDVYEHRIGQRHPNTCAWFLDTPQYCKWKNTPFDGRLANDVENSNWHERIYFVQAKPGYGKTFLSGQVIDDLTTGAEDLNISDDPPATAFFHFNAAHLYCTHPMDAFRAIAAQLVHIHRHDRSTLDALALLMRNTTGHEKASSDDVLAVCSLLLQQHSTFLVIDGIDECSNTELFLSTLPELCRKSDTRVLLFSRPNIQIPLTYQKWASDAPHVISLDETQNDVDVRCYITENLNQMADQGFFGINMDRTLIHQVAGRSNGIFLWASLLLKYLHSSEISPNERRVALEHPHLLEGVEALYRGILTMLDRRLEREKRVAVDVFRWLSLSVRRLCVPGTGVALAITPGRSTTEDQYLFDLAESIPHLTGGLVEVTDCSVLFIHRSVKEYLHSPECQVSDFSLYDESTVHAHLAARCISFLARDVPKRPLGRLRPYSRPAAPAATSSGTSVRTEDSGDSGYKSMSSASASDTDGAVVESSRGVPRCFDADIPFLRYASLCWPIHVTRALSHHLPRSPIGTQPDPFVDTPWLPVLSHFLADRVAITAWVEASWRYTLPPNISRLIPLLSQLKSQLPPATVEGRELRRVIGGLGQLSDALMELKEEYATTLGANPSLIWQRNTQHSTEGRFWPVWDESRGAIYGV